MASVDDRVVDMHFNNAEFEKKAGTTISTLAKLKESLNFGSSSKNLQDLSNATKSFSLEGISTAIDNVAGKFTALNATAFTVIQNITTSALHAGTRIASALTVDPIVDGLREYETNMNAIQTILANTKADGTNLNQVNDALDQLNQYSDKTIYNFGQMTKNIGTFTAAGVDLNTSVQSIKGISNLAAISGSNAEQASTAMYQLSQALAAGSVKLMDWNSIVNAGMGGEVFQKALFETGKSLGTIKSANLGTTFEEWTKAGNTFRGSLEEGWLTSKVLTNTLQGFTGDLNEEQLRGLGYTEAQAKAFLELGNTGLEAATKVKTLTQLMSTVKESIASGWSASFRTIIGDFEEAKTFFTGLNTIIGGLINRSAESRNARLEEWKTEEGREALIQALRNAMWALATVLEVVRKAFRDAFPKLTGFQLAEYTSVLTKFTQALIPSEKTIKLLSATFGIIFNVLSIGWTIVKEVVKAFFSLFSIFGDGIPGSGFIVDFFSNVAEKVASLKKILVDDGGIRNFFQKTFGTIGSFIEGLDLSSKINTIVDNLTRLRDALTEIFQEDIAPAMQPIIDGFNKFKDSLSDIFSNSLEASGESLINVFNRVKEAIQKLFGIDVITPAADGMGAATGRLADRWESLMKIGEKLGNFFKWVGEQIDKAAEVFRGFFASVAEAFKSGDFSDVYDVLNTGLFAGLIFLINKFLNGGILKTLIGGSLFDQLGGVFTQLTGVLKSLQMEIKAEAIMKIAQALLLLTASMVVLSLIDSSALTKSLVAMGVGFGQLVFAFKQLEKIGGDDPRAAAKLAVLSGGLILLSGAMLTFSLAVKVLSTMDAGELAKGTIAVGVLLLAVSKAVDMMGSPKRMISTGLGVLVLAKAVDKLADSVIVFGNMELDVMTQGLLGVAASLALLVYAIKSLPEDTVGKSTGIGLLGVALLLISKSITDLGNLDLKVIFQGLVGVAAALGLLVAAVRLMGSPKRMVELGLGLIAISAALYLMTKSISALGSMDIGQLVQGIAGIGAALTILALAVNLIDKEVKGALAIVLISGALIILAKALEAFLNLGVVGVLAALLGIGLVLGAIALGAFLLQPAIPIILTLAKALIALGVGMALVGASVALFGAGIYLIVTSIKNLVETGDEAINKFIDLFPKLTTAFAKGIIEGAKAFLEGAPMLIGMLGTVLESVLDLIVKYAPKAGDAISELIKALIKVISDNGGPLIEAGFKLLMALLKGIKDNIGEITKSGLETTKAFLEALIDQNKMGDIARSGLTLLNQFLSGISDNISDVLDKAADVITKFLEGIGEHTFEIVDKGYFILTEFLRGIAENAFEAGKEGSRIVSEFLKGLASNAFEVSNQGAQLLIEFLRGIGTNTLEITNRAAFIITEFLKGIGQNTQLVIDRGAFILTEFLTGIGNNIPMIVDKAFFVVDQFLQAIGKKENVDRIVESAGTTITNWLTAIGNPDNVAKITTAAATTIANWINGIGSKENVDKVVGAAGNALVNFLNGLTNNVTPIQEAGTRLIVTVIRGIGSAAGEIVRAATDTVIKFAQSLGTNAKRLVQAGWDLIIDFIDGLADSVDQNFPRLQKAGRRLVGEILNGMSGGLLESGGNVIGAATELAKKIFGAIKDVFIISSPSKAMYQLAGYVALGFARGLDADRSASKSAEVFSEDMINQMRDSMLHIWSVIEDMDEFNPVITPVLDMTNVKREAGMMEKLMGMRKIEADVSIQQASSLALATREAEKPPEEPPEGWLPWAKDITFTQINNSPKELSVSDVYRNTKSQISLAKEVLSKP